ncbi:MAG: aspartate kinase, partial [Akkermansiaceae bacterium]
MALIVQKYGGTSVGSIDRIKNVAQRIRAERDAGNQVVAVISAMGGVTDKLIALAKEISNDPAERELDVLLSSG